VAPPRSNREFVDACLASGDAVRIAQPVDWENEAGAIVRRVCELAAPAPLMESIKDYPGFRYFGAPLSTYRRMAISMGLDPATPLPELGREYLKRTNGEPVAPVLVGRGEAPCKENILRGADVDLCRLPVPLVHDGDGGRYVGTWHAVITRHPVRGDVNWGMYRQMMFDSRTMSGAVFPFSDLGKALNDYYLPRGESCPFATAIGLSPLAAMAACAPSPIPEPELTGMLAGEAVRLVKCETNDLEVPADAEIILEGEICPDYKVEEGPFGEYTGYRTSPRDFRVTFRVNCITYRNNATMTISNMGVPQDEGQLLRSFSLDPLHMLFDLSLILALPLAAGMTIAHRHEALAKKVHGPMRNFSLLVLIGFVLGALVLNWAFFREYARFVVAVVALHNALALAGGYGLARLAGLSERDRRAVAFETGIQNSGLGLVLVFTFFGGLGGMAIVTAWWGIWHIVAGMALSTYWMKRVPAAPVGAAS